jgi:hypothetical protein
MIIKPGWMICGRRGTKGRHGQMKISDLLLGRILILFLPVVAMCGCGNQDARTGRTLILPGARAEIQAGLFASLQAAIDAVPAEGGKVVLPPGEFHITEPLIIAGSDITLAGAGTATHIKNDNRQGQPAIILRFAGEPGDREAQSWRITLMNFRVTGNPQSGHGIEVQRVNEVFIHAVSVSHHGGDGIFLDHCYEDPRISNALITYNNGTGLNLIGCHDIVVSGNQFEENRDAIRCLDGFNLCMTGNNLDDHLGDGVVIENTYGSVVAGNMIEECQGRAIVLDRDCYGITLAANVIAHNVGGGIDLRDAHGCAVSANTFTIVGNDALRIGSDSGRIAVTGNSFSDSYIGGGLKKRPDDPMAGGLLLHTTSDISVVGNLFSGVRPGALRVPAGSSERVNFSGNVLTDVRSDHGKLLRSVVHNNVEP